MNSKQEILLPEYWQQTAERLVYSANALIEKLRSIQDEQALHDYIFDWYNNVRALLESNYMLLGWAAENSIKGFSIYKYIKDSGHPDNGDLHYLLNNVWKVKNGHNSLEIASKSNLYLTEEEKKLIFKLQEHCEWKGRYHIPTVSAKFDQVIEPGVKDNYGPNERVIITDLIERIGKEIRK